MSSVLCGSDFCKPFVDVLRFTTDFVYVCISIFDTPRPSLSVESFVVLKVLPEQTQQMDRLQSHLGVNDGVLDAQKLSAHYITPLSHLLLPNPPRSGLSHDKNVFGHS